MSKSQSIFSIEDSGLSGVPIVTSNQINQDHGRNIPNEGIPYHDAASDRSSERDSLLALDYTDEIAEMTGPRLTSRLEKVDDNYRGKRQNLEEIKRIAIETSPILALAFFGEIFTGQLLSHMTVSGLINSVRILFDGFLRQSWNSFTKIDELLILVPVLTNLKGNIEMTLSCRLSTAANLGQLTSSSKLRRQIALGNLALVQLQALIVALVAALVAFGLSRIQANQGDNFSWRELSVVIGTSTTSASLSGIILGSFMCAVVLLAKLRNINPDNIATPLASMLGDLLTVFIMGLISSVLAAETRGILTILALISASVGIPVFIFITSRNPHVISLLRNGWAPLFFAMGISTITGLLLDEFVTQFEGYALLAIINCSLPGAVGAVYSSRLSTSLHIEEHTSRGESRRGSADKPVSKTTAPATLFAIAVPLPIIFVLLANVTGWLQMELGFVFVFVMGFLAQLICSLGLAHALTNKLMARGYDPDMYALPIHSACVDVSGQLILVAVFLCVRTFGGDITVGAEEYI